MDFNTMILGIIGFIIALALFKFMLKLPFYIMTLAILGALGYAAYKYVLNM
ncbi:MAG: hypothetical protein IKN71_07290 [Alphaproteobacteria bacterium]|jgi:uncharacterized membrane protein YeaQ/YmgE (transglycosylase-associated protein family)|nr:hypothetical protein [Alphaproteobacteria bacterium]